MKLLILDFNRTLFDPAKKQLFPGAIASLEALTKQNIPLVLLTTESPERVKQITALGLSVYFKTTLFVPEKTIDHVRWLLQTNGLQPSDAVMIGDDPAGELHIGKKLGIPTIAVGTGLCTPQAAHAMGIGFCDSIASVVEELS